MSSNKADSVKELVWCMFGAPQRQKEFFGDRTQVFPKSANAGFLLQELARS